MCHKSFSACQTAHAFPSLCRFPVSPCLLPSRRDHGKATVSGPQPGSSPAVREPLAGRGLAGAELLTPGCSPIFLSPELQGKLPARPVDKTDSGTRTGLVQEGPRGAPKDPTSPCPGTRPSGRHWGFYDNVPGLEPRGSSNRETEGGREVCSNGDGDGRNNTPGTWGRRGRGRGRGPGPRLVPTSPRHAARRRPAA